MRSLILFLFVFSSNSFPRGGGDIIGNGGGIAESNFVHAYSRLYKLIDNCLSSDFCAQVEKDFYALLNIRESTVDNFASTSRLIFTTPEETPGIFFTQDSDIVRLAVSTNDKTAPIYVNLDMLYVEKGGKKFSALSYGEIVSILVHEAGHNIEVKNPALNNEHDDHLYLLGTLVRDLLDENFISHEYSVFDTIFNVNIMNFSQDMKLSEFWVNWDSQTKNITEEIYLKSSCQNGDKPYSIKFKNYHLEKVINIGSKVTMPINVWGELVCFDGSVTQNEVIDLYVYLNVDKTTGEKTVSVETKTL